jgi:protein SCO1/2
VAVLGVATGLGVFAAHRWLKAPPPPPEYRSAAVYAEPRALPAVELATGEGRHGPANQLLAGQWRLVFFGFTHCPEVCPGAMKTLDHVAKELATTPGTPAPVMTLISVDPRRDTPEVVSNYVRGFNPAFEGYSGSEQAIDELTRAVGVAVTRGAPDESGNYMVDHTSAVFVFDPQGRVRGILTAPLTAGNLAHDYRLIAGVQP